MNITKELLIEWKAKPERVTWFVDTFCDKATPYQFVLAALARKANVDYASWLMAMAGEQGPALLVERIESCGNVFYAGRIEVEGAIKIGGSLVAGGSITAGKSIKVDGELRARGAITAGKNIKVGAGLAAMGKVYAEKDVKAGVFVVQKGLKND